jgi:hypothetical protein
MDAIAEDEKFLTGGYSHLHPIRYQDCLGSCGSLCSQCPKSAQPVRRDPIALSSSMTPDDHDTQAEQIASG